MTAYRSYWTGLLKLSLVTVPVKLYSGTTEREKPKFHQIHEPSGERVRQQLVVPGIGPVERSDIVKGYEYAKNQYLTIAPEELACLKLETTDTLDLVQFVDVDDVHANEQYVGDPMFLAPDGKAGAEGYRAIRDALANSGTAGVGRVVISQIERTVLVRPYLNGLLLNALRYQDEVKDAGSIFEGVDDDPVEDGIIAMVTSLISSKLKPLDITAFKDTYQDAVRELIKNKLDGVEITAPAPKKQAQVVNLMDALKQSLASVTKPKKRAA